MEDQKISDAERVTATKATWRLLKKTEPTLAYFWRERNAHPNYRNIKIQHNHATKQTTGTQPWATCAPRTVRMREDDILTLGWDGNQRMYGYEDLTKMVIYDVIVVVDNSLDYGSWKWD